MRKRNEMLGGILMTWMALLPVFCAAQAPVDSPMETGFGTPFLDNAILQQQIPLPIWGTTQPEAKVTLVFRDQSKTTTAQKDGSWRVVLDAMPAERLKNVNQAPVGETMTVTCEKNGVKAVKKNQQFDSWRCLVLRGSIQHGGRDSHE